MHAFTIVQVLNAQANLHKIVKNSLLREVSAHRHFLNLLLQIAIVCILHNNAQLVALLRIFKKVIKFDNIRVVSSLKNFCFINNFHLLVVVELVRRVRLQNEL